MEFEVLMGLEEEGAVERPGYRMEKEGTEQVVQVAPVV